MTKSSGTILAGEGRLEGRGTGTGPRTAATFGLSHIALKVADLDRAVAFYTHVFGGRQYFRNQTSAQILGPGPTDVIAFELMPEGAGQAHFVA